MSMLCHNLIHQEIDYSLKIMEGKGCLEDGGSQSPKPLIQPLKWSFYCVQKAYC